MPDLSRESFVVVRDLPPPLEAAWRLLADCESIPRWAPDVAAAEVVSQPVGPGTIRRVQFTDYLLAERIEAWQPPEHLAYSVIDSPWPIEQHRVDILLCPFEEHVRAVAVGVFRAPDDQAEDLRRSFQVFLGQCLRNLGRLLKHGHA